MAGLKWNTGKLYYSTVELGYQQISMDGPQATSVHLQLQIATFGSECFEMHTLRSSGLRSY